jgi:anti-anti-sigma factor
MANAAEVEEQLVSIGNGGGPVVLDLQGLRYVDSAGIRMLFDAYERLGREGRLLTLAVAADAPVRRVLSITKLDTLVVVHDDVEGAVAAAGGTGQ